MQLYIDGYLVVNMETDWMNIKAKFEGKNDHSVYYLPNRAIFTTPGNLQVGTINVNDFSTFDGWFDKKDRKYYTDFGFNLDTQIAQDELISVLY